MRSLWRFGAAQHLFQSVFKVTLCAPLGRGASHKAAWQCGYLRASIKCPHLDAGGSG